MSWFPGSRAGCVFLLATACSAPIEESNSGFVPLFDGKTLAGWSVNRGAGDGQPAEEIFTVDDQGIHVYAGAAQGSVQPVATLLTDREYSRFELQLEYKWGTNRFAERANTARDAGVLFHLHGDLTLVWPPSLQMQLGTSELGGEWVTGDVIVLGTTTQAVIDGQVVNTGRYPTRERAEKPEGEWNQVRLSVDADKSATFELNGVVVNHVESFKHQVNGVYLPLERGRLAIEAEWAELWYRNISIKE
jgi:Domain of Unknown Function (DUF1080)